jgi:hypothetical protein
LHGILPITPPVHNPTSAPPAAFPRHRHTPSLHPAALLTIDPSVRAAAALAVVNHDYATATLDKLARIEQERKEKEKEKESTKAAPPIEQNTDQPGYSPVNLETPSTTHDNVIKLGADTTVMQVDTTNGLSQPPRPGIPQPSIQANSELCLCYSL